jgi:hypothetical protein
VIIASLEFKQQRLEFLLKICKKKQTRKLILLRKLRKRKKAKKANRWILVSL